MNDVAVRGVTTAGELAEVARVLGQAGIGLEGGGMWEGVARYLVEDGDRAQAVLADAGYVNVEVRPVVVAELDADVPGALGHLTAEFAGRGDALVAQYSDHRNRKVLVMGGCSADTTGPR